MAFIKSRKKLFFILLGVILLIVAVFACLELTGKTSFILDRGKKAIVDTASKTTSDTESAQANFSEGEDKTPTQSQPKPEIGVVDNSNSAKLPTNATPITSKDGLITVYSPTNGALFTSGSSLSGKTTASKISYRLMDNVSGVTATGGLSVSNGLFYGKFNFSTNATEGRLDVFIIGIGGVEKSVIEIPVRFR